jgi:CRISPR/Cas system CSM-associated protein Csm2 small subunit
MSEKKDIESIINKKLETKAKKGSTVLKVEAEDFSGKRLSRSKSIYKYGKQRTVEKGTKWEDIPKDLKSEIVFSKEDFK